MTDTIETPRIIRRSDSLSVAERLILAGEWDKFVADTPEEQRPKLLYDWRLWRRPNQVAPSVRWRVWFVRAGRGWGKTRTGAEWVREQVYPGRGIRGARRIALIGQTSADVRDVMIEGESGLLACHPPHQRPTYEPSKRRVVWPNGAQAIMYSAEKPRQLRGPQHEVAWGDEPAEWQYGEETFNNALLGLRLGDNPRIMLTGTPKPVTWLRGVDADPRTAVTVGHTFDNTSNLADVFIEDMIARYLDTRLGEQELAAGWVTDVEGALWQMAAIDAARLDSWDVKHPWRSLNEWLALAGKPAVADRRAWSVIVAVDPPGETAECGIIVATAPVNGQAHKDHMVVLEDASIAGPPEVWGAAVASASKRWGGVKVYVEKNQGGDMVRSTIHAADPGVAVEKITARESKQVRAEPVSVLYARELIHHVGNMGMLESQMTTWVPAEGRSPDRIDALVHAARKLLRNLGKSGTTKVGDPTAGRIPTR